VVIPTTHVTIVVHPTVVQQKVLARTGSALQPLAALSGVSLVLGILLLVGTGRPLTANVGANGSVALDGIPEKWGPLEIARTIGSGFVALAMALPRLARRRRS